MQLVLLTVLSVSFAQLLGALDFNPTEPRDVGGNFWLAEGSWSASIAGRTDLDSSVIELSLGVSDIGYDCYYSVWVDETKISHGTFNNVANNIIPLLRGTVTGSTGSELRVQTSGCVLGRYAVPFQSGAAGGSTVDGMVELVDISPQGSAAQSFLTTNKYKGFTSTIPDNFDQWVARMLLVRTVDSDCQFSSQACTFNSNTENFWTNPGTDDINGGTFAFSIPFTSNTTNLIVETSAWSSVGFSGSIFVFNSSAGTDSANFTNPNGPGWIQDIFTWDNPDAYTQDHSVAGSFGVSASGITSEKYTRHFYDFPADSNLAPTVVWLTPSPAIFFPYAKVWDLTVTDDPNHAVTKLNQATTDCKAYIYDGCTGGPYFGETNGGYTPFYRSVSGGDLGVTAVPSSANNCDFPHENWYFCTTSPWPFTTSGSATPAGAASGVQSTQGASPGTTTSASTGVTSITTSFTDGFLQFYATGSGYPYLSLSSATPAPGLAAYYDVNVALTGNTQTPTASYWDLFIQYPSATGYIAGLGSVVGGNLPAGFSTGLDFSVTSKVGYSANFYPYVFVHALPSTSIANFSCDAATTCNGNGQCNLDNTCACTYGWTGSNCSDLLTLCQTDSCMNGGTCSENPARVWDPVSSMFLDPILCDCTGTNVSSTGGDFSGQYCEVLPPCEAKPCIGTGAICNPDSTAPGGYTCDCSLTTSPGSTKPRSGAHCEVSETLPCDYTPCQNNGVCTNVGTGSSAYASCDCTNTGGFIGTYCDLPPIDKCTATKCGNYGVCIPSLSAADGFTRCVCTSGWSGVLCNVEPSFCSDKCQNGGHCVALGAVSSGSSEAYSCICPAPWVGMHCQWNETQWNSAQTNSAGMLVFLLVALVAFLF